MTKWQNLRQFIKDAQTTDVPFDQQAPQTMLMLTELRLLYSLARDYFRNDGHIIDSGCFLGGSTCALARGLLDNPAYQKNPRSSVIHSYDLFEVEPWTIGHYFPEGTESCSDFETCYQTNIESFKNMIDIRKGDITQEPDFPDMIEILFIDLAKAPEVSDHLNHMFLPRLIPGHSIVIQQDYLYPSYTAHLHITMEYFADYFEMMGDTYYNSVVFLYKKQIPQELLQTDVLASLSLAEMYRLSRRAESRFSDPEQRAIIRQAREQYMTIMQPGRSAKEVRAYKWRALPEKLMRRIKGK